MINMALVDYGSSDESCNEDNDGDVIKNDDAVSKSACVSLDKNEDNQMVETSNTEKTIFSSLPKPRGQMILDGSSDKLKSLLLNKPMVNDGSCKKEHVKILIPSLSDFESDDTSKPASKKIKPTSKGIGLFSLLPPPKHISVKETKRPLIPDVVKNQVKKPSIANLPKDTNLSTESDEKKFIHGYDEEDDDNDETFSKSYFGDGISGAEKKPVNICCSDSFNISSAEESEVVSVAEPLNDTEDVPKYDKESELISSEPFVSCNDAETNNGTLELDEKALQILCGGKRKRTQMSMNIIDLSGEEIMPDSKEWLLKQFTEEKKVKSHSHRKHEGPSVQQRRKHQITYLAFQAKEQELELQNQWSNNRMSRKQTQSKYGF